MKKVIVVTTVNGITEGMERFSKSENWELVIVSDRKTPVITGKGDFTSILDIIWQESTNYMFTPLCPYNHYARKNIGYIYAIRNGAEEILDTDDDNIPYDNWYNSFLLTDHKYEVISGTKFANVYTLFTDQYVWPRGFPLTHLRSREKLMLELLDKKDIGVIQGLADKEADVDSIYRLVIGEDVRFKERNPVILDQGVYCPINSQNTLWLKDAFLYLYLPVTVSFRFTDILRGYIAQRGLWSMDKHVAHISPTVFQIRNAHNLMNDFAQEIDVFLNVEKVISIIHDIELEGDPVHDIKSMYTKLFQHHVVGKDELSALDAWINDLKN